MHHYLAHAHQKPLIYDGEIAVWVPREMTKLQRAAALGCDGIVMGTHGMSPLGNMLMGSVPAR